jgi:hypothetical protein
MNNLARAERYHRGYHHPSITLRSPCYHPFDHPFDHLRSPLRSPFFYPPIPPYDRRCRSLGLGAAPGHLDLKERKAARKKTKYSVAKPLKTVSNEQSVSALFLCAMKLTDDRTRSAIANFLFFRSRRKHAKTTDENGNNWLATSCNASETACFINILGQIMR